MMATSATLWKTIRVCQADPLALSHPQANHSQSQGCRGEVSEESQHLIGDGLTDWMTEEVDFASYLPTPPSPTNASLPPSPLQSDIQVPSDLEVMTSLLQEELAQLEDYFLSEPLPEKGLKLGKCDKGPMPVGPQPFCQLPYAAYTTSSQPESSPLLVTLATGELDLLSICGGPMGRSKIQRHTPYNFSRPNGCGRKRVPDGMRLGDGYESNIWSSKGNNSGTSAVTLSSSYSCAEDERLVGKGYCVGSAVEIRCAVVPKEKNCCFNQEMVGGGKVVSGGFGFGGSLDHVTHKKEDQLMYGGRETSGSATISEALSNVKTSMEVSKATIPWKSQSSDGCYLQTIPQSEAYHSFLENINEQVKSESLQIAHQNDLHCSYLDDQGAECLIMAREGLNLGSPSHRQACVLKEDHCSVKYELDIIPEGGGGGGERGERKQKKRDQNKTAAHRYRQRKRAELDILEEQLHGLEGRNRELRDKAESVEREIQYVKDLLIEVYKARSQRLKQDTNA